MCRRPGWRTWRSIVTGVRSAAYLLKRTRSLTWDRIAGASAEVGVLFMGITLVSGSLWGRISWGTSGRGTARLTTTAFLFVTYIGYLAVRGLGGTHQQRARRSAVLALLAVLEVPLVHFSVKWWRPLHQQESVAEGKLSGSDAVQPVRRASSPSRCCTCGWCCTASGCSRWRTQLDDQGLDRGTRRASRRRSAGRMVAVMIAMLPTPVRVGSYVVTFGGIGLYTWRMLARARKAARQGAAEGSSVDLSPREVVPTASAAGRKRPWFAYAVLALVLVAGGVVVAKFLTNALDYYCNVDEVGVKDGCDVGRNIRIQGVVREGHVRRRTAAVTNFVIAFNGVSMPVSVGSEPSGSSRSASRWWSRGKVAEQRRRRRSCSRATK